MLFSLVLSYLVGLSLFIKITYASKGRNQKSVTVIIPARNEEQHIHTLLTSLAQERVEVLVMDDHSTDRTAEVAARFGVRVISIPPLPTGWLGKAWGCWNGAQVATGELLLFMDCDTVLEKGGIQRLLTTYGACQSTILSVHPYHKMRRPYEYLSSFFHMLTFAAMGSFHILRSYTSPHGAFGQCMVCSREDYFAFGGHEATKGELLENMAFGQHVVTEKGTITCISGKGSISMRMYPDGLQHFIQGWKKSFAKGASKTNGMLLFWITLWLNGLVTALFHINEGMGMLFYGLYVLQCYWILRRIGNFGILSAFLYPVHLACCIGVLFLSFLQLFFRKRVAWKGRDISMKKE